MRLGTIKKRYRGKKAAFCLLIRRKTEVGSTLERGAYSATPRGSQTQVFLVIRECSAENSSLGWGLGRKTLQGHCSP